MDLGHIGKLGWGGLKSCQFTLHTQHVKTPNDWSLPKAAGKGTCCFSPGLMPKALQVSPTSKFHPREQSNGWACSPSSEQDWKS